MKKLILLGTFPFLCAGLLAQPVETTKHKTKNTLEIHAKGFGNSTWLFNKNISAQGEAQDYDPAWGLNYGVGASAYFGSVGFALEAFIGNHTGGYSGVIKTTDTLGVVTKYSYTSNINLQVTQIPLLFKLKSDYSDSYLEAGIQYTMVSSAAYHKEGEIPKIDTAVTNYYSDYYLSAILGVGFKIQLGEGPVSILVGLRFQYGITDLKGVDALGQELNNPVIYPKANPTVAASGGLALGLIYKLGG